VHFKFKNTNNRIYVPFNPLKLLIYNNFRYERIAEFAQSYVSANREEKESMERQSAKDLRQIYSSLGIKNRRHGSYYLSSEDYSTENSDMPNKKLGEQPFGMIVLRTNDIDQVLFNWWSKFIFDNSGHRSDQRAAIATLGPEALEG
jgi:hypothetical protein